MDKLTKLRKQIDQIDKKIIEQLSERFLVVQKIGRIKKKLGVQPLDKNRWDKVITNRIKLGKEIGLSVDFIKEIYEIIHKEALKIENNL